MLHTLKKEVKDILTGYGVSIELVENRYNSDPVFRHGLDVMNGKADHEVYLFVMQELSIATVLNGSDPLLCEYVGGSYPVNENAD